VKIVASQYGRILADNRGQALYLFGKESSTQPRCYGDCAVRWPPVIAKGEPAAGPGAVARLLGTTRRRDGRLQLTYAGHPVYYYVEDSPGRVLCQNVNEFGGQWLIVRPSGRPVT
jgi:predicted lipoprotein with Yx(FWY)xxD motif